MNLNQDLQGENEKFKETNKDTCYSIAQNIISVKPISLNTYNAFKSINNSHSSLKYLQIGSEVFLEKENDSLIFLYTKKNISNHQVIFSNCLGYIKKDRITAKAFELMCRAFVKDFEFYEDRIEVIIDILFFD